MRKIQPGPDQDSVWGYPRPPRLEQSSARIEVVFAGQTLAQTSRAWRVLETSHPPVFYIPPDDIQMEFFRQTAQTSFCEWKGTAANNSIEIGEQSAENVAWFYPQPTPRFQPIKDYLAFYPSRVEACFVDGERVQAQMGDFYGGWITSAIVGPFKGEAGTWGW